MKCSAATKGDFIIEIDAVKEKNTLYYIKYKMNSKEASLLHGRLDDK